MNVQITPRLGQPCALGRGHVDNVVSTFHYHELVNGQVVERQQELVEGAHFILDAPTGRITLLEHGLWDTLGTWRAGDRIEPLLYKGRMRAPDRLVVTFEHDGVGLP